MSGSALVEVEGLAKAYREGGVRTPVLEDVSFTLARGEVCTMVGSAGAGKSTVLALLAGLLLADRGEVRFVGRPLGDMDESGRARLRARRIGVVLQSDNLIPFLTAIENVELAVTLAGGAHGALRAREILGELGLADRADDLPRRLSGGEVQRVALAVALVNEPDLLLADEITAELDAANAERVVDFVLDASRERELAVLMITHSDELAARAPRSLRIADGRVGPR